jgi:pyruvate/2-oxoglutarate dehydrogenase complex dihydrolipoamide acyltransferase (E2) component
MQELNTPWRRTAATIYEKPTDSKIIGSVEFDVTKLNAYIRSKRQAGVKVTPTHIFTLATARAIAERVPAMNTYVCRGNIRMHPQIDAVVTVLLPQARMGSVRLEKADQLDLATAVDLMQHRVKAARRQQDDNQGIKLLLARIPWPFRKWVYRIIHTLTVNWGLSIGGLTPFRFGSFVVSNIGSLGLDIGYPALLPAANVSFVLMLGGQQEKPCVVNGEIVVRTFLKVGIAMDHRTLDGSHGGELFKYLKMIVRQPELLEKPPGQ